MLHKVVGTGRTRLNSAVFRSERDLGATPVEWYSTTGILPPRTDSLSHYDDENRLAVEERMSIAAGEQHLPDALVFRNNTCAPVCEESVFTVALNSFRYENFEGSVLEDEFAAEDLQSARDDAHNAAVAALSPAHKACYDSGRCDSTLVEPTSHAVSRLVDIRIPKLEPGMRQRVSCGEEMTGEIEVECVEMSATLDAAALAQQAIAAAGSPATLPGATIVGRSLPKNIQNARSQNAM